VLLFCPKVALTNPVTYLPTPSLATLLRGGSGAAWESIKDEIAKYTLV